jgi:plastocyanin
MAHGWAGWGRTTIAGLGAALLLYGGAWSAVQAQGGSWVAVQAFVYDSAEITVPVGTTVTWTNNDPVAHTVTDVNQTWDSGLFDQGVTFSKTFDAPGVYDYYCIPHPMMIGKVVVTGS